MLQCKCGNFIPQKRVDLGYRNCVSCSTEAKWSGVQVVHHKTGNEIQVVKDPEVAAEFIAKSTRTGFGTLRGMVGSWKKPVEPKERKKKKISPSFSSFNVITKIQKIDTKYLDDEIGPLVLDKLENEGSDVAKIFLEEQFQSMKISPSAGKRLLHVIENDSICQK